MRGSAVIEYSLILAAVILLTIETAHVVGTHIHRTMRQVAERVQ
jgi:Flp pilus assembly pilin Flp